MSIGAGIAIAGVWIFAGLLGRSDSVSYFDTGFGVLLAIAVTAAVFVCA